ncbi:MAG: tryptophan 2,3-dioxygenase family protein, partial [Actinomycetota bacterium]|nr:tryptophan 2,3-dioxygenase family protein [Actinomycetota bacterium]
MNESFRPIEEGVATDLRDEMTYASYLQLPTLLAAQQPVSDHHDEMLFIIQHQVTELWLKQLIHELRSAMALIAGDDLPPALKRLARVKAIQRQMFEQWSVLETLTPIEYVQFRDQLGKASGFQSPQYRTVEFLLGNKNPQMIAVFAHDPDLSAALNADLAAPSLYEEFLRSLTRRGYAIPSEVIERDFTQPYERNDGVVAVFKTVY